jgi:hypothetical protein
MVLTSLAGYSSNVVTFDNISVDEKLALTSSGKDSTAHEDMVGSS